MKILLAESAGFCFGVKRASRLAFESAEVYRQICSLGPLIHSPQLVRRLEEKGVKVVESVEEIPDGAVIIRSHGLTAGELKQLADRNLTIVDATCPFVKKAQEFAARLSGDGYTVVLIGEAEHPEVQGIVSYVGQGEVFVVANRSQAEKLPQRGKLGIVAQTTQAFENLQEVVEVCLGRCRELRIHNTICDATTVRQREVRDLARDVDLMLVIGGYNSANTTRLAQISREIQPRTYHVETAEQVLADWFEGVGTVGVTAGASTPGWLIEEVVKRVEKLAK